MKKLAILAVAILSVLTINAQSKKTKITDTSFRITKEILGTGKYSRVDDDIYYAPMDDTFIEIFFTGRCPTVRFKSKSGTTFVTLAEETFCEFELWQIDVNGKIGYRLCYDGVTFATLIYSSSGKGLFVINDL